MDFLIKILYFSIKRDILNKVQEGEKCMDYKNIIGFFERVGDFRITKLLKQRWNKDRYSYITHPRQDHGLMLIISGDVNFASKNKTLTAKKGDVVFLPKNSFYEAIFDGEVCDYLVNFDIEAKNENEISNLSFPTVLFHGASASCFKCFFDLIEENYVEDKNSLRRKGLFYLLLDSISNHSVEFSSLDIKTVEMAKGLLCDTEELSISEIAFKCGISESGLRKKFKDIVGVSPKEYRMNIKLNRAKYYLESTGMSVSDISNTLNFYDSAYFCKMFKLHIGVTPRQYSKNKSL